MQCYICHAKVPDIDGPVCENTYLPQSPGCWQLYTDVLAKEFGEWKYPDIHRLTVDCYAAQHPTKEPNPKSAQSVTVHLLAIYLALEKQLPATLITKKIGEVVNKNKGGFQWMNPPENLGNITITNIHDAKDLNEHIELVTKWAHSIWEAWKGIQPFIRELASR